MYFERVGVFSTNSKLPPLHFTHVDRTLLLLTSYDLTSLSLVSGAFQVFDTRPSSLSCREETHGE